MTASVWHLLADNQSAAGKAATSAVLVLGGWLVAAVLGRLAGARRADAFDRYVARKLVRYAVLLVVVIALAVLWRPFAGRLGLVLGFVTAGVAFAMQEVIGAFAGFVSIFSGGLYRVGDRVEVGGVRGDVIDISPLRTKLMEMGSPQETSSWVGGRQFTGRIVSVSNKSVFTTAVFNYSASFDFLWEELVVPIPTRPTGTEPSGSWARRCGRRRRAETRARRSTGCAAPTRSRPPSSSRACSSG